MHKINKESNNLTKEYIEKNFFRVDGALNNHKVKASGLSIESIFNIYHNTKTPLCKCGNKLSLHSFKIGYRQFCSSKCSNADKKKIQKGIDSTDYAARKETTIKSLSLKDKSYWDNIINKRKASNLIRFGFESHQSSPEYQLKMKKYYLKTYGAETYLNSEIGKKASQQTKLEKYGNINYNNPKKIKKNERLTKVSLGIWIDEEDKEDYALYRETVVKQTEVNYKKYYKVINENNLNRSYREFHLDHRYSIISGFNNNIPTYIIASHHNLEMLFCLDNISKGGKCSISLDYLLSNFFV